MKARTPDEIAAEIKALQACKAYVPHFSFFQEDNHHKLDLQIEELRDGIDDTADEWNDLSDGEQDAVREAKDWKEGQVEESPSSGWDNFKPEKK